MINVNIRYKGKELSTILPKCNDELRADLKKAGIDLPAEKLKLRSSPKNSILSVSIPITHLMISL